MACRNGGLAPRPQHGQGYSPSSAFQAGPEAEKDLKMPVHRRSKPEGCSRGAVRADRRLVPQPRLLQPQAWATRVEYQTPVPHRIHPARIDAT